MFCYIKSFYALIYLAISNLLTLLNFQTNQIFFCSYFQLTVVGVIGVHGETVIRNVE